MAAAGYSMGSFLFIVEIGGEKEERYYIDCTTHPIPVLNSISIFQTGSGFGEIAIKISVWVLNSLKDRERSTEEEGKLLMRTS